MNSNNYNTDFSSVQASAIERDAKLKELNEQLHRVKERLALIAEKFLDGELSKEEKTRLSELYSAQIEELHSQINEICSNAEQKHSNKKKSPVGKIIIWVIAAIIALFASSFALNAIMQANYERKHQETVVSNYKKLLDALESGRVRYGMTYQEIAVIVGEADRVSRSGGEVKYAYYYKSSAYSSYDATEIQLCFNNGRLYNYNSH